MLRFPTADGFLKKALLPIITFGDRISECQRQGIAIVWRRQSAPSHVILALQQERIRSVVAALDIAQIGDQLGIVGQTAAAIAL